MNSPFKQNRLADATSPYLLQHKDNPVHWQPWEAEVFDEARRRNVPILLSIGYAACHWCHVMAHESFEDDDVAALMNTHFVCIKLDREERPDLDDIYMSALSLMGEQGGWPLTMCLDADGAPFWGGTYFPKTPQYGRPGFMQILTEIARIWHDEPAKISKNAKALTQSLSARAAADARSDMPADLPARAAQTLNGIWTNRAAACRARRNSHNRFFMTSFGNKASAAAMTRCRTMSSSPSPACSAGRYI